MRPRKPSEACGDGGRFRFRPRFFRLLKDSLNRVQTWMYGRRKNRKESGDEREKREYAEHREINCHVVPWETPAGPSPVRSLSPHDARRRPTAHIHEGGKHTFRGR